MDSIVERIEQIVGSRPNLSSRQRDELRANLMACNGISAGSNALARRIAEHRIQRALVIERPEPLQDRQEGVVWR